MSTINQATQHLEKTKQALVEIQLKHETRYEGFWNWSCSCGLHFPMRTREECHEKTRQHWADLVIEAMQTEILSISLQSQGLEQAAKLQELSKKATQREWILGHAGCVLNHNQGHKIAQCILSGDSDKQHNDNAAFIVACVNYVRAALAKGESK